MLTIATTIIIIQGLIQSTAIILHLQCISLISNEMIDHNSHHNRSNSLYFALSVGHISIHKVANRQQLKNSVSNFFFSLSTSSLRNMCFLVCLVIKVVSSSGCKRSTSFNNSHNASSNIKVRVNTEKTQQSANKQQQ